MEAELTNGKFPNLKKYLQLQKSTILDLIDYFFWKCLAFNFYSIIHVLIFFKITRENKFWI